MRIRIFFQFILLVAFQHLQAQYHPPAGQAGTSAMHKDSSDFVAWATYADLDLGLQQIGLDSLGPVIVGNSSYALGKAGENPVVSLGDGGSATLQFEYAITNGPGWDFAVFENSMDGHFLELAFVEVSSDGIYFVRFPASSLTDTSVQVGAFDLLEARKLNNLAGKYQLFYGVPFDLSELEGLPGIDVLQITHVRIIDVVGSILPAYCSRDASGRKVVDPFPTPFPSSGFDLDAVGVIHTTDPSGLADTHTPNIRVYPQPAQQELHIDLSALNQGSSVKWSILALDGRVLLRGTSQQVEVLSISSLSIPAGSYVFHLTTENGTVINRFIQFLP